MEGCGQVSRGAKEDPEFLMGVPERLAGSIPGAEKSGSSNSGSFALRNWDAKPISSGNTCRVGVVELSLQWALKLTRSELQSPKLCHSQAV